MPLKAKEVAAAIFTLAIVVTGAKLGSDLKTERKVAKEVQKIKQQPTEERIAYLEQSREGLVAQKMELEEKIRELRESEKQGGNKKRKVEGGWRLG